MILEYFNLERFNLVVKHLFAFDIRKKQTGPQRKGCFGVSFQNLQK